VQEFTWTEASGWVRELKWPQEVGSLLEVGANSEDLRSVSIERVVLATSETYLVDQVFDANDAIFAKVLLDDGVVRKGNALLVAVSKISRARHMLKRVSYILPYPRL
jgi:hypothetical protein